MVKFDYNKFQIYDKNKSQIITTIEIAPNKYFHLKCYWKKKLALSSIIVESPL